MAAMVDIKKAWTDIAHERAEGTARAILNMTLRPTHCSRAGHSRPQLLQPLRHLRRPSRRVPSSYLGLAAEGLATGPGYKVPVSLGRTVTMHARY
jgi:hypothetical protein